MKPREAVLDKLVVTAGSCMIVCGFLMLGPLGFLLLLALFYAMLVQNLALGLLITVILCTPAIFGAMWAVLAWVAAVLERVAPVSEPALITVQRADI
jgi:hypothetical protein